MAYKGFSSPATRNSPYRNILMMTAVIMGILGFVGMVLVFGGLHAHDAFWLSGGTALAGGAIAIYFVIRHLVRKISGQNVSILS